MTNTPEPIPPQPGSSLRASSFVGRTRVTRIATQRLSVGSNLILADPRRMGKTEWIRHLARTQTTTFTTVLIDYEGVRTSEEFLLRTATVLREQLPGWTQVKARLISLFDETEVGVDAHVLTVKKGLKGLPATRLFEDTIAALALDAAAGNQPTLLVAMDELPQAILNIVDSEGAASADQLLQTLRRVRQAHPRVRWLLCGSIGFHHALRKCGSTEAVFNDLVTLQLGPLDDFEADELADRLLRGAMEKSTPDAVAALVDVTGAIPFLMHKIVALVADRGEPGDAAPRIRAAFSDFMHDRDASRAVTHLVTRLDLFYEGVELAAARQVLNTLALASAPVPAPELASTLALDPDLTRRVLDALADDHYLVDTESGLRWRYDVLRRVWVVRMRLAP